MMLGFTTFKQLNTLKRTASLPLNSIFLSLSLSCLYQFFMSSLPRNLLSSGDENLVINLGMIINIAGEDRKAWEVWKVILTLSFSVLFLYNPTV